MSAPSATLLATSLKMYLDHDRTVAWARAVRDIAAVSAAAHDGTAQLAVFPSFPSLAAVADILRDVPVDIGAQNMAAQASGAFTGEVSAASLRQVGCTYVEIGHAERRRLFGETPNDVRTKVALALDHDLTPLLCVGEQQHGTASEAATTCIAQVEDAISAVPRPAEFDLVLAYEPEWAIGAQDSADPDYIRSVAAQLNQWARRSGLPGTRLIYGGSAKPGLLTALQPEVDGLFLGRFAHDARALATILGETSATPASDRRGTDRLRNR